MTTLADTLRPILPDGLTPEMVAVGAHQPGRIRRHWWEMDEALDPLAALSTKKTADALQRGSKVLTPAKYQAVKDVQGSLRASYEKALNGFLNRAVEEGPKAREKLLAEFEKVAYGHLSRAHALGVRVTARGDAAKIRDSQWERYLQERANHDRLHFADFLSAIWEKREKMPRDKRRDLYTNNLDAMFHQGALAGTRDEISIFWKLCITTPTSRVLTGRGWIAIERVRRGDLVWTHKNRWRRVLDTSRVSGAGRVEVRLHAPGGAVVGCTDDHTWLTAFGWLCPDHIATRNLAVYTLGREDVQRPDRGEFLPVRTVRAASLHGDVRDRGWKAHRNLPVAVEVGACERSDSGRVGDPPQERKQAGRSARKSRIEGGCQTPVGAYGGAVSTESQVRNMRDGVSNQGGKTGAVLRSEVRDTRTECAPEMSEVWEGGNGGEVTRGPSVLLRRVLGEGEALYDLTVEDDRSFIVEGLVSSNSPAEHCFDCIGLAANAPYAKPGVKFSGLPPLPTVPRRGDTQCLANCKCFLSFVDSAGKAVDPGDKPGVTVTKPDGEDVDTSDVPRSVEIAEAQKRAEALQEEMQYAKAMYDQTGDKQWLKRRKAANDELIALQDETGLRFVPNAPAGKMSGLAKEAQEAGWTPGFAKDAPKFTQGQFVGVVHGTEFSQGSLTTWDAKGGRGSMTLPDGRTIQVGTADSVPTIMFAKALPEIPAKPWKIEPPKDYPNAVPYDVPGRPNVVVDVPPKKATVPPDNAPQAKVVVDALKVRPPEEAHGLNVWLMEPKERGKPLDTDTRKKFGSEGVELIPGQNAIALRGMRGKPPDQVREALWAGVGAKLYRDRISGGDRVAELGTALARAEKTLTPKRGVFINGTAEERAFGAAYTVFVAAPEVLQREAPALFDLIRDILEDIEATFSES